jgi:hypothetical protein
MKQGFQLTKNYKSKDVICYGSGDDQLPHRGVERVPGFEHHQCHTHGRGSKACAHGKRRGAAHAECSSDAETDGERDKASDDSNDQTSSSNLLENREIHFQASLHHEMDSQSLPAIQTHPRNIIVLMTS